MSGRQVYHAHVITSLLPYPAGGRHVPAGREVVSDLVQHVRGAAVSLRRRTVRQRSQRYAQGHVSARKRSYDSSPDLPHVLDPG